MGKKSAMDHELTLLKDVVPVKTPMGITISIGNTCDFRCNYCFHDFKNRKPKNMSMEEFELLLNRISEFGEPIKQISFVSSGETLLNHNLPMMIKLLKEKNIVDKIKIVTNGRSLKPKYTDELIKSGVDIIKISLQGLNSADYKRTCGVDIDYDIFYNQIKYLYEHRGNCKVHVKVIDVALSDPFEKFYEMYNDICDSMYVEHVIIEGNYKDNKYNTDVSNAEVCPMAFFSPFIDEELNVFPCCNENRYSVNPDQIIGNLKNRLFSEIWNKDFKILWEQLLTDTVPKGNMCYKCLKYRTNIRPEDVLDDKRTEILDRVRRL